MNKIALKSIAACQSLSAFTILKTSGASPKLAAIDNLFTELHSAGIMYCHWKSNEHLDASMTGDTDLDILFDEKQKALLEPLLARLGFKKFRSIAQKQYRDIEDFLCLDLPSGKLVHLHAHFRLTMGEPFLKSYQLDLEEKVLSTRVFDEDFGIYRTHPALELVLLYIREALKTRNRDIIKLYLNSKVAIKDNLIREYKWLKQRCSEEEIAAILESTFTNYTPIYKSVTGKFARRELYKLSIFLKREFKIYRLFSPLKALILRWHREVAVKVYKAAARLSDHPVVTKRINPHGGLVVAVVGADGSGKSNIIANLQSTFQNKLDVYSIYFGRGEGKTPWPRKLLRALKNTLAPTPTTKPDPEALRQPKGFLATLYKCLEALMIAREKNRSLKLMLAAKAKGMLVVCDHFPQNQLMGYNDGPLLHHLARCRNPVFRVLARREARAYARAENHPPAVLFKLMAETSVGEARKPGQISLDMPEAEITGVTTLTYAENCRVVTIDAAQSLERVLFTIKKEIWNAYANTTPDKQPQA